MYQAYDIRGIYPEEINAASTIFLAKKFFEFLKKNRLPTKILLALDERASSEVLAGVFAANFPGQIENIGLVPVPLFYHLVLEKKRPGAMITASHLPQKYNGFKFFLPTNEMWIWKGRIPTDKRQIANSKWQQKLSKLPRFKPAVNEKIYLSYLKTLKRIAKFKQEATLEFHSPKSLNAYVFKLLPKIFSTITTAKTGPWRLTSDLDGDRLFFYWRGKKLLPEHVLSLILPNSHYRTIGLTANLSQQINRQFPDKKFIMVKTGHKNFKEAYLKSGIDFGFESSHHFHFFKDLQTEAPLLGLLKVLQTASKINLDEFLRQNKFYVWRFNLRVEAAVAKVMRKFVKQFGQAGKIKRFDGIELGGKDWRIHLRPSNTEAKLRIFAEATDVKTLGGLKKKIRGLIM